MEAIRQAYLDPERGFSSVRAIAKETGQPQEMVRDALRDLRVYQRTLPSKENRKKTTFRITAPRGYYQIDYIFIPHPRENDGYVGFLLCVEITTRKAYAYPIRNKTIGTAEEVLSEFINEVHPLSVSSDNKSAFISQTIQDLLDGEGIKHTKHAPEDHNSMGILDRLARTIKEMLTKYFLANDTLRWLDVLPSIIRNYNKREHRTLGMSPNEMEADLDEQEDMRGRLLGHNQRTLDRTAIYEPGDLVRFREPLGKLEKLRGKYSDEVYTIHELDGLSYVLRNENGNIIRRKYRPYELVRATPNDEVHVVDVIKVGREQNRNERRVRRELGEAPQKVIPRARRNAAVIGEILRREK